MALVDHLVHLVHQDHPDHPDQMVHQAPKDLKDHLVLLESKETQDL